MRPYFPDGKGPMQFDGNGFLGGFDDKAVCVIHCFPFHAGVTFYLIMRYASMIVKYEFPNSRSPRYASKRAGQPLRQQGGENRVGRVAACEVWRGAIGRKGARRGESGGADRPQGGARAREQGVATVTPARRGCMF